MIFSEKEENLKPEFILESLVHPAYFPNITTMSILASDDIIWEVQDNFQKQTYRNRCHICTDLGKHMLNIPIVHVGGNQGRQRYKEVKVDNTSKWQRQHWRTLQTAYRTSPFFEFYEDDLAPIFEKEHSYLLDLNFLTIDFLCSCLSIEKSQKETSTYKVEVENTRDRRYLINAKTPNTLKQEKYNQVFGDRHGFVEQTSMLDLLFNEGPNSLSYLKKHSVT